MALRSKLLAGIQKLEQAAVSDPAHIMPGSTGLHVAKIQSALVLLDQAKIDPAEMARTHYGQTTAAAVLAFKTKRNIINRAYQSRADNIVGRMTIAALDAEMLTKAPPPAPVQKAGVFFVTADVKVGQSFSDALASFGLDPAGQLAALRDPHNDFMHGGSVRILPDGFVSAFMRMPVVVTAPVIVPIDVRLTVNEFRPVIDMQNGLLPRLQGDPNPPTNTHGLVVRIGRNLGPGMSLNWIQTARKVNNPDRGAPLEFVDVGQSPLPFVKPPGPPPPDVEMRDDPSAPIAPRPGAGVDFTAMTTLVVLARGHIILAAAKVWRYVVGTSRTLPDGVRAFPPRDATDAEFSKQLGILRTGINQLRLPTGGNLDYVIRPPAGGVVP
jgi:hypothetical protein